MRVGCTALEQQQDLRLGCPYLGAVGTAILGLAEWPALFMHPNPCTLYAALLDCYLERLLGVPLHGGSEVLD